MAVWSCFCCVSIYLVYCPGGRDAEDGRKGNGTGKGLGRPEGRGRRTGLSGDGLGQNMKERKD